VSPSPSTKNGSAVSIVSTGYSIIEAFIAFFPLIRVLCGHATRRC
jgi:hypothetical protein